MNDEKAIEQLEEFLVIDDWSAVYMPYLQDAIEYVINRIKALEDRPTGEWIPVSERLPEVNGVEVIVTDIETNGTYTSWYLGEGFWECDNGKFNNRIIAWQPLPEPYKKGGAE